VVGSIVRTSRAPAEQSVRPLGPALRAIGAIGLVLVFLAGVQLFVLADHTERDFAWTLLPLTAAFIGSFYWSSLVLIVAIWRNGTWAAARRGMPAVVAFTLLTLIATLVHLGLFHLHSQHVETVVVTWIWIVVYAAVPVLLIVAWVLQVRVPGTDPPRTGAPPGWFRAVLGIEAVVFLAMAAALFVAPGWADARWPWPMTPLAGRIIAAWMVPTTLLLWGVVAENDWGRARPALLTYLTLGILTAISVARYPHVVEWGSLAAWALLVAIGLAVALGGYGAIASRPSRFVAAPDRRGS
jgi:hypothetical protein